MAEVSSHDRGQFCWIDLVAHDKKAAMGWYAEIFGWEPRDLDTRGGPPYAMFHLRGKVVAGVGQMSDEMKAAGVPPMWNSYVSVDDAAAIEARARDLGAKVVVPAMSVLEAGRLAFFEDPTGASFAVWQAGEHQGASLLGEPGALCWSELATRDVPAAEAFYAGLFGWEYVKAPTDGVSYLTIRSGGRDAGGIIGMDTQWEGIPPHWAVYFGAADVNATVERIQAAGGKVHVPPTDIQVGVFSVVSDPQGGTFSVIQRRGPGRF
jgi:predicted enzyme related to lactoylglutathione lyase